MFGYLSGSTFAKVLLSFFDSVTGLPDDFDGSEETRGLVKREALVIMLLFGVLEGSDDEKWDAVMSELIMRHHSLSKARILVCWASASDEKCKSSFSDRLLHFV